MLGDGREDMDRQAIGRSLCGLSTPIAAEFAAAVYVRVHPARFVLKYASLVKIPMIIHTK